MPIRPAKVDYVLAQARTQGARRGARAVADLLVEWVTRRLFQWQLPSVEWGRDVVITGRLSIRGTGRVVIGDGCFFDGASGRVNQISTLGRDSEVTIGPGTRVNGATIVAAERVQIGTSCLLGQCTIVDTDFHPVDARARVEGVGGRSRAIAVGDRVWLGTNVLILKGVTIGDESVVGAGSVVRESLPGHTLLVEGERRPLA